ncbi:hypothetical protein C1646_765887 [Rhizophagus diaphanus]|nr:hypothetical protein C1646_765887 [Rhizophagus diaphanus] [Rhizophagus sp. MUCL 43196]
MLTKINSFEELSNAFKEEAENYFCNTLPKLPNDDDNDYESNLIRNNSIVALKHVATGKYLSSIDNLCFCRQPRADLNALWKITFKEKFPMYNKTSIKLRHIKSGNVLGLCNFYRDGFIYPNLR